jgi:diacylglycerol kinase family enzyme
VPGASAIALDGECIPMDGPFAFRSLPGALPVMLPHAPMRIV